jgi:hypothetical protein
LLPCPSPLIFPAPFPSLAQDDECRAHPGTGDFR